MLEFGHHYGIRVDGSQLVSIPGVNFVLTGQDYAQIGSVATLPEWRRKGFLSLCIKATINSLFQAGIGKCGLFVEKSNPYLIDFYRKPGFQPAGSFYFFLLPLTPGRPRYKSTTALQKRFTNLVNTLNL